MLPGQKYTPQPWKIRDHKAQEIFDISDEVFGSKYYCVGDNKDGS